MKTEEDKSKEQGKVSNRYQTMGMSMGMCFGVAIGLAFGNLFFDHGTIGMCFGLPLGMLLGMVIGVAKDDNVKKIEIHHGDMEAQQFQIGDFVYIDEDGNMESVGTS